MRARKVTLEKTETGLLVPSTMMGGDVSEDAVQLLAEHSFFPDFVFRKSKRKKGKHLKPITDVLIWFDKKMISVQIKGMEAEAPNTEKIEKWVRTNLSNAYGQAEGTKRHFSTRGNKSFLFNDIQGTIEIDHERISEIHSLIVLDHPQHNYHPARLVPELGNTTLPTHVMSLEDFRNVCAEFSTIPDFVNYLTDRQALMQAQPIEVGRETDLLAWYIFTRREEQNKQRFDAEIRRGLGDEFLSHYHDRLRKRKEADRPSRFVDDIIEKAHILDPNLTEVFGDDTDLETERNTSIDVIVDLSYLNRLERRVVGKKLFEKAQQAAREDRDRCFPFRPNQRGTAFLFLCSPSDRHARRAKLTDLTSYAKHLYRADRCLGIATEPINGVGRSYDFCIEESAWEEDTSLDELCKRHFSTGQKISEEEFPE
jgi:hypothetical protein